MITVVGSDVGKLHGFSSRRNQAEQRTWITRTGVRIVTRQTQLEPSAPAVCFLHGYAEGAYAWTEAASSIAPLCPYVAFDLRGHGDSDRSSDGCYGLQRHIDDVIDVLEQMQLRRIVLIGHSMGGQVAINVCSRLRDRMLGLALVDICSAPDPQGMAIAARDFAESLRVYSSIEEYMSWLLQRRPLIGRAVAHWIAQGALKCCENGFRLKADPALASGATRIADPSARDLDQLAARIVCPTLVVRGAGSAYVSVAAASALVRQFIRGRLTTIPQAGHAVMTDNPVAFNQCIYSFVASLLESGAQEKT